MDYQFSEPPPKYKKFEDDSEEIFNYKFRYYTNSGLPSESGMSIMFIEKYLEKYTSAVNDFRKEVLFSLKELSKQNQELKKEIENLKNQK
jgi:hypothetical protein